MPLPRSLDMIALDVRAAVRSLRGSPGVAAAAVTILALAIGVNAVFFTLYSHFVLEPLPIRGADRHVEVTARDADGSTRTAWTPDQVHALRAAGSEHFEGMYTSSGLLQVRVLAPTTGPGMVMAVSPEYFQLLGARVAEGRALTPADADASVAVLSASGAARLFPGRASPVGTPLRVGQTWFTVVGVLAPEFTGTDAAVPDFWVDEGMRGALRQGLGDRQYVGALLQPGVATEAAAAPLVAPLRRLVTDGALEAVLVTRRAGYLPVDAPAAGTLTTLLFATFLLVLAVACANLANLFVARMATRRHEITIRYAMGAHRWRVVRQLVTEAIVIGTLGAAVGVAGASLAIGYVQTWLFSLATAAGATLLPIEPDWRLFLYAAGLGLVAGVAFGLLPALDATDLLRRRPRRHLRVWLLGAQVAASVVLLILAGVLVRHIQRLDGIAPGYDTAHVLDLQAEGISADLLTRLHDVPGVLAASAAQRVPLGGRVPRLPVEVGRTTTDTAVTQVDEHYFDVLGLPVVQGRGFTAAEAHGGAPVAVVSVRTAETWGADGAVGRTLRIPVGPDDATPPRTVLVVGVVPDVVQGWLFEGPEPAMVYLAGAAGQPGMSAALVRVADDTLRLRRALADACLTGDGSSCAPRPLDDVAAQQRFPFHAAAWLAAALGIVALGLTAVGLFSVVSQTVAQREREIAVLAALGAPPARVVGRLLAEPARSLAAGLAVGLPFSAMLSWLGRASALHVATFDPGAWLGIPLLLALVAAAACLVPAWRALRVSPMLALRQH